MLVLLLALLATLTVAAPAPLENATIYVQYPMYGDFHSNEQAGCGDAVYNYVERYCRRTCRLRDLAKIVMDYSKVRDEFRYFSFSVAPFNGSGRNTNQRDWYGMLNTGIFTVRISDMFGQLISNIEASPVNDIIDINFILMYSFSVFNNKHFICS